MNKTHPLVMFLAALLACAHPSSAARQRPKPAPADAPAAQKGASAGKKGDPAEKRSEPAERRGGPAEKEPARLPQEAELIVADARVAPAEFGADALIRVAESAKVSGASLKRELLEEAFRLAAGAQQPFKRFSVVGNVDTRAGYLSYGFELGLDALSLRCRAVRAMLRVDASRARELLAEIRPELELDVLACEDPLPYDVSALYETAGEVARAAFGPEELRRREHVRMAEPYVASVRRVAQVGPAARLIVALRPPAADLSLLAQEFASALRSVPPDARSFAAAYYGDDIRRRMSDLLRECDAKGVGKDALLEAYRAFFVAQAAGVQCADNKFFVAQLTRKGDLASVNDNLVKPRLSPEELQPRRYEGRARSYEFWQTADAKRLLLGIKRLRFGDKREPLTPEEKETTEWRRGLAEYLAALSDWEGSSEQTASDYINQKSVLFGGLLSLDLSPEAREKVLADYLAFLREPGLARDSRVEWYWHVRRLADWARAQDDDTYKAVADSFANSDVAALRLYAALEAFAPAGPCADRPAGPEGAAPP